MCSSDLSATTTLVLFGRGRWTPGWRLRTVDGRRGSGLGWPCGNGLMGFGHGIARHGWRPGATRVASSSARPGRRRRSGWHVGAAAPDLLWRGVRGLRVVLLRSMGYKASTPRGVVARVRAGDVGAAAPVLVACACATAVWHRVDDEAPLFMWFS